MSSSKAKFDALFHKYGSLWKSLSSNADVLQEIALLESIVGSQSPNASAVHVSKSPIHIAPIPVNLSTPLLVERSFATERKASTWSINDSRNDESSTSSSHISIISKECIDLASSSSESVIEIDLSHLKINEDGEIIDDRDNVTTSPWKSSLQKHPSSSLAIRKFPSEIQSSSSISSHSSSLEDIDELEWKEEQDEVNSSGSDDTSHSCQVIILSDGDLSSQEDDDDDEYEGPLDTPSRPIHKSMRLEFARQRDVLTQQYFQDFNQVVFSNALTEVRCHWSKTLRTTAGYCKCQSRPNERLAEIELSIKVVDSEEKLKNTLMHEMCHAAAWLVDGITKPPHGECFKKWASLAMKRCKGIVVTTRHDYNIAFKYAWGCTNPNCDVVIQRHSRSFKVDRYRCAKCKSPFVEIEVPEKNECPESGHQIKKRRDATGFSLFVKEKSAEVRTQLLEQRKHISQPEVMKECARLWALRKSEPCLDSNDAPL